MYEIVTNLQFNKKRKAHDYKYTTNNAVGNTIGKGLLDRFVTILLTYFF